MSGAEGTASPSNCTDLTRESLLPLGEGQDEGSNRRTVNGSLLMVRRSIALKAVGCSVSAN